LSLLFGQVKLESKVAMPTAALPFCFIPMTVFATLRSVFSAIPTNDGIPVTAAVTL